MLGDKMKYRKRIFSGFLLIFMVYAPLSSFATAIPFPLRNSGYKVRTLPDRVILEDGKGKKLHEVRITGVVVGALVTGSYVISATRNNGIFVHKITWRGKLTSVSKYQVKKPVVAIRFDKGYLFIVTKEMMVSTWILKGETLTPYKSGKQDDSNRIKRDKRYQVEGKIISVKRGLAVISVGEISGLKMGDRLSIISKSRKYIYDPLLDKTVKKASNREVAVLEIIQLGGATCVVKLGLGDEIKKGDFAYYTRKSLKSSKLPFKRWGGMKRLTVTAYPGLLFGDVSLAMAGQFDYHATAPIHLQLKLRPWIFEDIFATDFAARVGFENTFFEAGVGFGAIIASHTDENDKTWVDSSTFIEMFVRLGSMDSTSFTLGMRAIPGKSNPFNGFWTSLQFKGDTHLVSLNFDMIMVEMVIGETDEYNNSESSFSVFRGDVTDRIRLWGNGGPGTLYLPITIGITAAIADTASSTSRVSFVMGGGLEYRW
jgi:hypothetical protein